MALVLKDRVRETSTTTGTGSFTLGGTSTGFQSFSVIGDGNTTYYGIVNSVAGEWEVGIGTYTASGTVLSRDTILESSNGGSAVNFSAGTKDVFVTYPAEKSASTDTFASPPAIGSTTPAAGTFTTLSTGALTATGQTSLGANGANNAIFIAKTGTGAFPTLTVEHSSGNSIITAVPSSGNGSIVARAYGGAGSIQFQTNGASYAEQLRVTNTASAVNYVQVTGSSTSNWTSISAQGSDTNITQAYVTKGSGQHVFGTNGASSNTQLRISHVSSAINYATISGGQSSGSPIFGVAGTDTNISQVFQSKGTGAIDLAAGSSGVNISNGGTVTAITRTAGGTGYATAPTVSISAPTTAGGVQATATVAVSAGAITTFTITNAGSGYVEQPTVSFSGGGGSGAAAYAQVGATTIIKGLGPALDFYTPNTSSSPAFRVADYSGSAATGYWSAYGGNASPILRAVGATSGSIQTGSAVPIQFITNATTAGAEQFRVAHTASAVNYVQVTGNATTGTPIILGQGSDANVNIGLVSKGSGEIRFASNSSGSNINFRVLHTTSSAVNYGTVTGAAAGSSPVFSVAGSDTNIDLTLTPKGTGSVVIGSAGLLVGTTTTSLVTGISAAKLSISGSGDGLTVLSGSGNDTINVAKSGTPSGTWVGFFAADGTGYGNITVNGAGTAYNTTSDYRLKNIDGPLVGAKDFIMALKPKQGTWKADGSKFVGFVADEFQQVSPTSVTGEKDAVDSDGKPIYQTMQASSSEVMANLIALVQEQQAVIEQLKADVAKLKAV